MASVKIASSSTRNGYEPQTKKPKMLATDADLTDQYIKGEQPGRVPVHSISWLPSNRGGHGILQRHANDIAKEISISHAKGKTDIGITNEIETFTDDQLKGHGIDTRTLSSVGR